MPTMPNVMDLLSPRIYTGVVRDLPKPPELLGFGFLPEQSFDGDKLEWDVVKGELQIAPMVAPGAESPLMDVEQMLTRYWAETAYIRFKTQLREGDVRNLRDFGADQAGTRTGNMAQTARNEINRRIKVLNDSVDYRLEYLQMASLLGSVVVSPTQPENVGKPPVSFSITYPVRTVTAFPEWDETATADPYLDMRTWFAALKTWRPARVLLSQQALFHLSRNEAIARLMLPMNNITNAIPSILSEAAIGTFFAGLNLQVIVYDSQYTTRTYASDGTFTIDLARFLPENKAIFLPAEPLGLTATTPAPQNNWQTGKFAFPLDPEETGRKDPWIYEYVVGYYGFPLLQKPDRVLVATLWT